MILILYISHNNNNILDAEPGVITAIRGLIYNRLQYFREANIKNRLLSGKQQIGVMAVANREFSWSADRLASEDRARRLTLSDLPKLPSYVNKETTADPAEI